MKNYSPGFYLFRFRYFFVWGLVPFAKAISQLRKSIFISVYWLNCRRRKKPWYWSLTWDWHGMTIVFYLSSSHIKFYSRKCNFHSSWVRCCTVQQRIYATARLFKTLKYNKEGYWKKCLGALFFYSNQPSFTSGFYKPSLRTINHHNSSG